MPSPFPGMNPFLEQDDVWQDFHDRLITVIGELLSPQLSPHFIVKIEEHLYIHEPPAEARLRVGKADVGVLRSQEHVVASHDDVATLEAPETIVVASSLDIDKQTFIEIRTRQERELVATLEVLSPSNKKPGPDREQYLAKRWALIRSEVHFVEIDLLRGGPRMPYQEGSACDYCVLVSRAEERPRAGYWPIALREKLPTIPVPVRSPLTEAHLNLQEALNIVYDRAYYVDYIYQGMPQPVLNPVDSAWAQSILQS